MQAIDPVSRVGQDREASDGPPSGLVGRRSPKASLSRPICLMRRLLPTREDKPCRPSIQPNFRVSKCRRAR